MHSYSSHFRTKTLYVLRVASWWSKPPKLLGGTKSLKRSLVALHWWRRAYSISRIRVERLFTQYSSLWHDNWVRITLGLPGSRRRNLHFGRDWICSLFPTLIQKSTAHNHFSNVHNCIEGLNAEFKDMHGQSVEVRFMIIIHCIQQVFRLLLFCSLINLHQIPHNDKVKTGC